MEFLTFFTGEEVTIVRSEYTGIKNRAGNQVPTETRIVTTAIIHIGKALNETSMMNVTNEYQTVQDNNITLIFPEDTVIKEDDKFIVRQTVWKINGRQQDFYPEINKRFIPKPVIVKIRQRKGDVNV